MRNKCLKIVVFLLLITGVIIGLNRSIHQKTNWEILKMENVEALTSPEEENPYYPCVSARGFCFMNGIYNTCYSGASCSDVPIVTWMTRA